MMGKDEKQTIVVSFVSGKGGVGKTALIVSIGKLLSIIGYKVLVIDSDFTTHGLTFLLGFDEKVQGILELLVRVINNDQLESMMKSSREIFIKHQKLILHLSENLHFIQSASKPSVKYSDIVFSNAQRLNEILGIIIKHYSQTGYYDFILIDSQAGAVQSTFADVSHSNKTVIVMEPDPVSTYATKNLISELGASLPRESYYVINKLSFRETIAYTSIEQYLRIIDHLPPIPFDFEVRRAFMIRQIPVDENKPSSFMFGTIRLLKDLLPQTSERLNKLEKDLEEIAIRPTEAKMEDTARELDILAKTEVDLRHQIEELKSLKTSPVNLIRQGVLLSLPILMIIYTAFALNLFGFKLSSYEGLATITATAAATVASAYFYLQFVRQKMDRKMRELRELEENYQVLRERQERLRGAYESYRLQLISRREELLLKSAEDKNQ